MRAAAIQQEDDIDYPSEDTETMGDTDFHLVCFLLLREALEDLTQPWEDVYVASNLYLYYEQGNPSARKSPDAMVVKGVKRGFRRIFKTWEEKAVPCAAFEIASKNTWPEDVEEKPAIYARIGIGEYFLYDPEGRYLRPQRLRGFRLRKGKYVPIKPAADGSLISKELGVRLVPEGVMLRLIDLQTGQPIRTRQEVAEELAKLKAELHQRPLLGAQQLTEELAKVKAELAALRAAIDKKNGKS